MFNIRKGLWGYDITNPIPFLCFLTILAIKNVLSPYNSRFQKCKKSCQPTSGLFQFAQSYLLEEYDGYLRVFMDISVHSEAQVASTAFYCLSTDTRQAYRIPHTFSTTTAELAQIDAAFKHTNKQLNAFKVVILTDSCSALSRLLRGHAGSSLQCSIKESAYRITSRGVSLVAQWIPSHVGIHGNEEADRLASSCAHKECNCPGITCMFDNARLLIHRHLLKQHPDQHIATGSFPPHVRGRGLPHRAIALLCK